MDPRFPSHMIPPVHTLARGLSVWLVTAVAWLTWSPFILRTDTPRLQLAPPTAPLDIVGNLLLLAPLAAMLVLGRSPDDADKTLPWALGLALLLSVVLEAGQWFVAGRVVSPYDVLLNGTGAAAAAWAAASMRAPRLRAAAVSAIGAAIYASLLIFFLVTGDRAGRGFELTGWDAAYAVIAGDEFGGGRRYRGQVAGARICAGVGRDRVCTGPGADRSTRRRLVAAAQSAQRLRLEAWVRSGTDDQEGPARIVTFSRGPDVRNATLAQEGRALVLRLRTPITGPNGGEPEFHLADAIEADRWTRVTAGFERGAVRLRAQRPEQVRRSLIDPGLLDGWLLLREPDHVEGKHLTRARLSGGVLLLFPLGLVVGLIIRCRTARPGRGPDGARMPVG